MPAKYVANKCAPKVKCGDARNTMVISEVGSQVKLFDGTSVSKRSAMFTIQPGTVALLAGLNMPCGAEFLFERVILEGGFTPDGDACNTDGSEFCGTAPEVGSSLMGCGAYRMGHCDNVKYLTIPGNYRVVMNCETKMLGVVSLYLTLLDSDVMDYQPDDMMIKKESYPVCDTPEVVKVVADCTGV